MRETTGVPGDPTQAVSLDRSVGAGDVAPVMGGEPYPRTQVDARTSVYGPGVTEARGAEVASLMRGFAATLEHLALERTRATDCVLIGRDAWVAELIAGIELDPMLVYALTPGSQHVLLGVVDRHDLARRLEELERPDDVVKVVLGPPDAPTPGPDPRARLLVSCADADCLAVTWSQSWEHASKSWPLRRFL